MEGKQLIDTLREAGHEPRSYSGRGMYGRNCVGVDLNHTGDLFRLGIEMGEASVSTGAVLDSLQAPRTDSMGRGIIAYWEWVEWPEGEEEFETWECALCGEKNREADSECQNCGEPQPS